MGRRRNRRHKTIRFCGSLYSQNEQLLRGCVYDRKKRLGDDACHLTAYIGISWMTKNSFLLKTIVWQ